MLREALDRKFSLGASAACRETAPEAAAIDSARGAAVAYAEPEELLRLTFWAVWGEDLPAAKSAAGEINEARHGLVLLFLEWGLMERPVSALFLGDVPRTLFRGP